VEKPQRERRPQKKRKTPERKKTVQVPLYEWTNSYNLAPSTRTVQAIPSKNTFTSSPSGLYTRLASLESRQSSPRILMFEIWE